MAAPIANQTAQEPGSMDQGGHSSDTRDGDNISQETPKLSKNQLKKQRKREKWLAVKQEKRRLTKQNRKRRLAEMREKGKETGPTRKSLKSNRMKNSSCKIRVVLDLSLDDYMTEKDVNSLTCQLQHSYSANRRAENPMQLYLCGLHGRTLKRMEEIGDYRGWDLYCETKNYDEIFSKESLIYLSSESPNILSSLSEDNVYIIGGLVDHNQHKGLCHRLAEEKGIAHAQLPISEYLNMKTRKVLAVNHVFSILLRYTEKHDWREAFLAEMPQRKQAHLKEEDKPKSENDERESGNSDTNSSFLKKTEDSGNTGSDKAIDHGSQESNIVNEENTSQIKERIPETSGKCEGTSVENVEMISIREDSSYNKTSPTNSSSEKSEDVEIIASVSEKSDS